MPRTVPARQDSHLFNSGTVRSFGCLPFKEAPGISLSTSLYSIFSVQVTILLLFLCVGNSKSLVYLVSKKVRVCSPPRWISSSPKFSLAQREIPHATLCLHTHLPRCKTCLSFHSCQMRNMANLVWIACGIIFIVVILAILKRVVQGMFQSVNQWLTSLPRGRLPLGQQVRDGGALPEPGNNVEVSFLGWLQARPAQLEQPVMDIVVLRPGLERRSLRSIRRDVVNAALQTDHGEFWCVVCSANRKDHMLTPCNHVCLCSECATENFHRLNGRCPMCRGRISGVQRVYFW